MSHIVKRLKDNNGSDSIVRDACRDCVGGLGEVYLKNGGGDGGGLMIVGIFVKPLLEVIGEQSNNKNVAAGAAACLGRLVEASGGGDKAGAMFQRLCPRICKLVGGQGVLAKGALLYVFSSLSQVGAIGPQSMPAVLQSIRDCLDNSDWAARKAAADTLIVLASHSSQLIADGSASTIAALETCRFDKVKPVRDSMMEALQLWKNVAEKGNDQSENPKEEKARGSVDTEEKMENKKLTPGRKKSESLKDSSSNTSPKGPDSVSKEKSSSIPEKILKKKLPLTDKEMNPEFFQKLEKRITDDLPVEVVVPQRHTHSSHSQDVEQHLNDNGNGAEAKEPTELQSHTEVNYFNNEKRLDDSGRDKLMEIRTFRGKEMKSRCHDFEERTEMMQRDISSARSNFSRTDGSSDNSFVNSKGNWLIIQRQLSQLERQQANLMNMLQDFMGGSHDGMVTLENRVHGLERVVEEMARDLSLSSSRRSNNMMLGFEGSPSRSSGKYNGLNDYSSSKFGSSRMPFAERYLSPDNSMNPYSYSSLRNGFIGSRRGLSSRTEHEHESEQPGSRRAWDKAQGPFRLGEGPSARSVWQASKDEATLEAIRVAGEDSETSSRIATRVPVLDAEALTDDNTVQDKGPLWASWTRAMDSIHAGDVDSAYAEVLSMGDDALLVKLMEKTGPVVEQLSNEVASEVLHAVAQFLGEQSLFDLALIWIQQLTELIVEHGADYFDIIPDVKKEILFNLQEVQGVELPEDWDGATVEQIMVQLASSWEISLQ